MRLGLAAVAIALLLPLSCLAAERLKSPSEARQLTDRVMNKLAAGELEPALRLLKPYSIVPDSEFETMLGQAKLQEPVIAQRFGKRIGVEFIREDRVGDSLLRLVQIQKFERHIIRWTFIFYRTGDGWVLDTFNFDDNIRALFP